MALWAELLDNKEIVIVATGAIMGYFTSFLIGIGKIRAELSFIKGQLTRILHIDDEVDLLKERYLKLEAQLIDIRRELDQLKYKRGKHDSNLIS